jgi:hypothetical protein
VRVATAVMLLCLAAAGVLIATPPKPHAVPRPRIHVVVEHRTVEKRLPRRTKVKRVYVDAPAPTPVRTPVTYARATPVRTLRTTYHAPAAAPAPTPTPRPAAQTALPTDAASLHQWEEVHHRDAPNHDQLEHQGASGG